MRGHRTQYKTQKEQPEKTQASVIFIKRTPHGELARRIKKAEKDLDGTLNKRVKVVERNGPQLVRLFTRSVPWAGEDCNRPQCKVCTKAEDKTPNCEQKNLTYKTSCKICDKVGTPSVYVGETSRSLRERMQEHSDDARNDTEGSHIANHLKSVHPQEWKELGAERDGWQHFSVIIVKTHQSAFRRQLHEAVSIKIQPGTVPNNQEEYNRCLVLTLELRGKQKESKRAQRSRELIEEVCKQETERT